jgi:hypothetical protein
MLYSLYWLKSIGNVHNEIKSLEKDINDKKKLKI